MVPLDWDDIWVRLQGMLWGAAALGLAGLCAGAWIYGLMLDGAQRDAPALYAAYYDPSPWGEAARAAAQWLRGGSVREAVGLLLWLAGALWLWLLPEARGRRTRAAAAALAGLVGGAALDQGLGRWAAHDLWVRFGALLGCGSFLAAGWALGERRGGLARRAVRGGLAGGYIGLACAFAAEIELLGYAAGVAPGWRSVLTPAVCGAVIGLTLRGAELLLAGPLPDQWRRYWPLALLSAAVLLNALGPALWVQYLYAGS